MNNRELIYSLIRLSLAEVDDGFEVFEGVTVQQWQWAFSVLSLHGLAGFAFDLVERMQEAVRPPKEVVLKFAAVMSEVSVRHLGLALEDVPECIRTEMVGLKPKVVERFIDDLFRPYEQIHQKNIVLERLHSVRRIVKAAWKPKEFLGQSAVGFVWDKFVPILMGRKFEAD